MSTHPHLSLIVAKSRNGVIGKNGKMPWHLSSDLQFFKRTTLGKPVLMGRVTWDSLMDSLGRALPGRPNVVLTRDKSFKAKGAEIVHDMHEMIGRGYELAGATGHDEVMIIGGAKLYAATLPYVTRMYITEVDAMIEGDAHFPAIMASDWDIVSQTSFEQTSKDDYPFVVKVYERRS
ncbi:MAG: dihydrofolate reductase [Robiginitomaculum sp.]|nr:MAG: dihydrofolate reductase [Robiginitomaculum sp.]